MLALGGITALMTVVKQQFDHRRVLNNLQNCLCFLFYEFFMVTERPQFVFFAQQIRRRKKPF
jgi:hypothetical protein